MSAPGQDLLTKAKTLLAAGAPDQAAEILSIIVERDPRDAEALHLLGIISYQYGRIDDAVQLFQSALTADPHFIDAMANLATALLTANRVEEAEKVQRQAIAAMPGSASLHFNLANILVAQGRLPEAVDEFRTAVSAKPDFAEAWSNLGTALRDLNDIDGALAAFEAACAHRPDYVEARYNLANALRDSGRLSDAEQAIRKVIALRPDHAKAFNALGNMLSDMAKPIEANAAFTQAVRLDPNWMPAASNLLSSMQYLPGIDRQSLADAHGAWAARFAPMPSAARDTTDKFTRDPAKRLKIGFVSPDFGNHPVGYFTDALFANLDHDKIAPVIFSTRPKSLDDELSRRISQTTDWRAVDGLTDEALFEAIKQAHIDILFDMSGHTAGHRLKVMAHKPAPVQVSWIGYVGTTGISAVDYVLADRIHAPEEESFGGPEKILRMPHGYVCYAPPQYAADVGPPPNERKGSITFGCLNNPAKLNDAVLASFARIAARVPGSSLLLRFKGLEDAGVQSDLRSRLAEMGLDSSRVLILGRGSHGDFLTTYNDVDIALDTFPYSGGLTTCEAMWMGVPVVTFPGATFAGRHASSHLHAAGCSQLVAPTLAEFENLAVALALDRNMIRVLRQSLRQTMKQSPLCDGALFARDFEHVMRQTWHAWCETPIT
ncbi:MAG: tetratricopeptide repeat protein [Rhodobacteraceae bacterium]|nr:tetratricopeptide repeat protein [Paracoccaceae bacterium]